MTARPAERWLPWIVLGAAVAWLLVREWHYAGWMDDDAFIAFRYARNFARGLGLVFNPGERVEGYTNFLWTVLMAGAARAGLDIPSAAQALGAAFSLATLGLVAFFGRRGLQWIALLPVALLCVSESWAAWAVGGLENVPAAFFVVLALWFFWSYLDQGTLQPLRWAAVACSLAAMTHPTHLLVAGVLGAALALEARRGRRPWLHGAQFAAVVAALYGTYFIWRWIYYGALLPNTFYAKVGVNSAMLARGLAYFASMLQAFPLLLVAAVATGAAAGRDIRVAILTVLVLSYTAYAIWIGGEAFPALRLFVVPLPIACLLAASGVARLAPRLRLGAALVLVAGTATAAYLHPRLRQLDIAVANDNLTMAETAGRWMKQNFVPGAVLAFSGAGVVPFYGEMPFIDTLGLTDAHIAHTAAQHLGQGMAGHERGDGRYVLSRQPDWIMFTGRPLSSHSPNYPGDNELFADQNFHLDYEPVRVTLQYVTRRSHQKRSYDLCLFRRVAPHS